MTLKPFLGVRGLDYSAARIPGKTIRAAGYQYAIRYVDDPKVFHSAKHIEPAEYQDLRAAGVDVWLVYEVKTTDMLAGHDAGVAAARRARRGADWAGYPSGGLIFMACDMHLTAAQIPAAIDYIDGATEVLGAHAIGVYGFSELINRCAQLGKGAAYWLAGSRPQTGSAAHIWQRNDGFTSVGGVACDINELFTPLPGGQEEDDMALSDDDRKLLTEVRALTGAIFSQMAGEGSDLFVKGKEWTGWPTWKDGTSERLTVVDFLRRANVQLAGGGATALSAADVELVAARVAELLATRLAE